MKHVEHLGAAAKRNIQYVPFLLFWDGGLDSTIYSLKTSKERWQNLLFKQTLDSNHSPGNVQQYGARSQKSVRKKKAERYSSGCYKNKPWLNPCLKRKRPGVQLFCSHSVIQHYTLVIYLDKRLTFWPSHMVHTRLEPLAQCCLFQMQFSPLSIST